ncbi:MAG: sce7726 family protein [Patescibacteria group bacterium]|nr:sce7726 family protein [Patescibacteria group bacterium]
MKMHQKKHFSSSRQHFLLINDHNIRVALINYLEKSYSKIPDTKIIEELGITHGAARIDIAVINGVMHGYEIKSDIDTLERLPEQMDEFNTVFDKVTLVVGKRHLYDAINLVPDWWGIMLAKVDTNNMIIFNTIREDNNNPGQVGISIARLLWREEALQILEKRNKATGVRSKPREFIYERLANTLNVDDLKEQVRYALLISREDWRSDLRLILNGD